MEELTSREAEIRGETTGELGTFLDHGHCAECEYDGNEGSYPCINCDGHSCWTERV